MTADGDGAAGEQGAPVPDRDEVRRVSMLVRALAIEVQRYADSVSSHVHLNRSDLTAIGYLEQARREGRDLTQSDLGRALRLSGAAITAMADRLERTGHLRRTRSELDRRKIILRATEQSRRTSRALFMPLARVNRAALDTYSDAELRLVAQVLEDLLAASREVSQAALPDLPDGGDLADGGDRPHDPNPPQP